jgi:hypothetical protein
MNLQLRRSLSNAPQARADVDDQCLYLIFVCVRYGQQDALLAGVLGQSPDRVE